MARPAQLLRQRSVLLNGAMNRSPAIEGALSHYVPPATDRHRSIPEVPATTLSDSDPAVQAGSGQLLSFDRFSTKDPFVQQVKSIFNVGTR